MTNSDMTNSDMTNSDMTNSDMTSSDMTSSDMTSSDMTSSDMTSSDTTTAPSASAIAPWRASFLDDISTMSEPSASFATVSKALPSPTSSPLFVPRVRTVVMRCMFAALKPHHANAARLNPRAFDTELPTFTTDARMKKVGEILASGPDPDASSWATCGGGPVEVVFWAEPRKVQWRLAGRAYVLGPDVEDETASAKRVRDALGERMHVVGTEGQVKEWNWAREVTAVFGNMSPESRGWFRNPPPGKSLGEPLDDGRLRPGQPVDDLQDTLARENFRVVVVVPDSVDRIDLSDPSGGKRWSYRFVDGTWETKEVHP